MKFNLNSWQKNFLIAVSCVCLQILIILFLNGFLINKVHEISDLCMWDCVWYTAIAENGYISTIPPEKQNPASSNVAFFPAFPLMGHLFHLIFQLPVNISLVLISYLGALIFWFLLSSLSDYFGFSKKVKFGILASIFVYPASFTFNVGYTESFFLSALLGFIWASLVNYNTGAWLAWGLTAFAGFMAGSLRSTGLFMGALPIIYTIIDFCKNKTLAFSQVLKQFSLVFLCCLGTILFFAFCQWKFGVWDLYFQTVRIGWGHGGNLLFGCLLAFSVFGLGWLKYKFLKIISLEKGLQILLIIFSIVLLVNLVFTPFSHRTIGLLCFASTFALYALLLPAEYITFKNTGHFPVKRSVFYFASWLIFVFYCSAFFRGLGLHIPPSIMRYIFVIYILFLFILADLKVKLPLPKNINLILFGFILIMLFTEQLLIAYNFMEKHKVF